MSGTTKKQRLHRDFLMFFIVGTGRNGSTSIAELLSQSSDCICLHEPKPKLISEATNYLYDQSSHDDLKQLLLQTRPTTLEGKQYGESNHKLSTIIPVLQDTFPDAKFIWLIRDGRDVVASFYGRKSYNKTRNDIWEANRIRGDRAQAMSKFEWWKMSSFEKCCWYWSFMNTYIAKNLTSLGINYYFMKLENLEDEMEALCSFLKISSISSNTIPHLNKSKNNIARTYDDWSLAQKKSFIQYCGSEMDKWYPDWSLNTKTVSNFSSLIQNINNKTINLIRQRFNN